MRVIFLLLLVLLVAAGCGGGDSESVERSSIGDPAAATNAPDDTSGEGGVVIGPPSLDVLDDLPRVGVGTGAAGCSGTQLQPSTANAGAVKTAILCLLNVERSARKLAPLRTNARLAQAATLHSRDMVARRYFSHVSLSGETFVVRIKRAGYLDGARAWTLGENLAWGSGSLASPTRIVQGWMQSPGHRANILNGQFREIGIGLAFGVPVDGIDSGATYNTGFGARQ
jgi:uncharacterized protein YkwD